MGIRRGGERCGVCRCFPASPQATCDPGCRQTPAGASDQAAPSGRGYYPAGSAPSSRRRRRQHNFHDLHTASAHGNTDTDRRAGSVSVRGLLDQPATGLTPGHPSAPLHVNRLGVKRTNSLLYTSFSLPAGSLPAGPYTGDVHSTEASYRLHFWPPMRIIDVSPFFHPFIRGVFWVRVMRTS